MSNSGSIMQSMENFFKSGGKAAAPTPAAAQSTQTSVQAAANNVQQFDSANANAQVADAAQATPLEAFSKLWETDATKTGAKPTGVLPAITAEQLKTSLANSDFLSSVPQELMTKASAGDAAAFKQVMNLGMQNLMIQSVMASHGLVEAGARTANSQFAEKLPSMVRSSNAVDAMQTNPLYNNPAAKPIVDNIRSAIEAKNPSASASEIAKLTNDYLNDFAKLARGEETGSKDNKQQSGGGDEFDWFKAAGFN